MCALLNSKGVAPVAGREYFEDLCMKAVNQCIGRVIRHRGDWAAILLVDQRWTSDQSSGKASCLPTLLAITGLHTSHDGRLIRLTHYNLRVDTYSGCWIWELICGPGTVTALQCLAHAQQCSSLCRRQWTFEEAAKMDPRVPCCHR